MLKQFVFFKRYGNVSVGTGISISIYAFVKTKKLNYLPKKKKKKLNCLCQMQFYSLLAGDKKMQHHMTAVVSNSQERLIQ